jgi:hypothetical protein
MLMPEHVEMMIADLLDDNGPALGTPEVKRNAAHDLRYLYDIYMSMTSETEDGSDSWHNLGADIIINHELDMPYDVLMQRIEMSHGNPDLIKAAVEGQLRRVGEVYFRLGYLAGEGPEHITKCTCVNSNDLDPTRN